MTCIVAIGDGKTVVLGADSAAVENRDIYLRQDPKVFRKGDYVLAFTTSFRMGQILRYQTELPEPPVGLTEPDDLECFLVTRLVPVVRKSFEDHGFAKQWRRSAPQKPEISEEGQVGGGAFLIGLRGHVFEIWADYHVGRSAAGYAAQGAGAIPALSAFYTLAPSTELGLRDRAERALEAAETFSTVVRRPFRLVELPASDVETL